MPKAPKTTNAASKKAPAKSRSSSKNPPPKTRSPSRPSRSEKAASSSATRDDAKAAASRKRAQEKAKQQKEDAKIREKTSALMMKEIEEENATERSRKRLSEERNSSDDDDDMMGDIVTKHVVSDSDEEPNDGDSEKAGGGDEEDSDEEHSEDGKALGIEVPMSDTDSLPDELVNDKVEDGDLIVHAAITETSRCKRRSSGGSTFSKVTRADFSPKSLRLAEAGRTGVRVALATGDEGAFPEEHKDFTQRVLEDIVKKPSAEKEWARIFEESLDDMTRLLLLLGYSWAGASQMRGELKRKANTILSAHFGIPAKSKAETMELVNWLLEKGHFKYGGLDTRARKYDTRQPMGHPIFVDLISQQWFSSGKAEGVCRDTASRFKDIPLPIIVLVITVVENALMEYKQDGTRTNMKFSSEVMRPRYTHHMRCAKELKEKSPKWFADYQKTMYTKILEQSPFTHLLAETNDGEVEEELDEIDFAALEETASRLQGE